MRLLNTTTIQLHEFDDQLPLYAILSHRWEEAEVTFQDLIGGKGVEMKGYGKILGCCAQAREDGFEFAWIDSCCINKASSAELSEAINSMFHWYQNAQVCYAYLSDVPAIEKLDHFRDDSEFRRSKWFTRGWTLQELLAPEIVVFYNQNWAEIGTKAFMSVLIGSITNIEPALLTDAVEVKHACVAQKMSWASRRKTSRLEDTAYCLMGLFDVNMPLLYGEGKKAFYRLQLEIIRNSSDESIFAWGLASTNVVPKVTHARMYGLLAEDPGMFQGSEDIVRGFSLRPPYTMTNKGLQIKVHLVRMRDTRTINDVPEDYQQYPKWVLSLHCYRREDYSNHVAVYLLEGQEGLGWARVSDLLLLSPYSPLTDSDKKVEWREIIIQASQDTFTALPSREDPRTFLLEVRSVIHYGYSVCVRMNNDPPDDLRESERSTARFESVTSKFRLLLECKRPQDTINLVLTRQPQKSRKVGFRITLDGGKADYLYNDRVLLPSGKIAKVIQKRRAESGKPIDVAEVLIE